MEQRQDLILGYTCNNDCIHCFNREILGLFKNSNLKKDKSFEDIRKLIEDFKEKGIAKVTLTGGEPTIRSDFLEILSLLRNNNFKVVLQTNGRTFSSSKFVERMVQIIPDIEINVSFHHTKEDCFDRISRVKGSYYQTVKGIDNLLAAKLNFLLRTVITKQNYAALESVVEFCLEKDIRGLDFQFVSLCRSSRKNWRTLLPTYTEIRKPLISALKRGLSSELDISVYCVPFCFLPGFETKIKEIYSYLIPHVTGMSFKRYSVREEDILNELVINNRVKTSSCRECRFNEICLGVWKEYLEIYGEREFVPVRGKSIRNFLELKSILKN